MYTRNSGRDDLRHIVRIHRMDEETKISAAAAAVDGGQSSISAEVFR
jgi:hypothetical protein